MDGRDRRIHRMVIKGRFWNYNRHTVSRCSSLELCNRRIGDLELRLEGNHLRCKVVDGG